MRCIVSDGFVLSFSDRPSTPQTSVAPTPHTATLNANMQSPRQNNAPPAKDSGPLTNLNRNNSGGKIFNFYSIFYTD